MFIQGLKLYGVAFVLFFIIDLIWLGLVAKDLYQNAIGFIMSPKPNWIAAVIFYLIFIGGLVFFVIYPSVNNHSVLKALGTGMLFGFITYATYDLTNLATLEGWPIKMTIIDLVWGTVLGGSVSALTAIVAIKWL